MESNTKTELSTEQIESIIKNYFGTKAKVKSVTEFTEGWFNAVYMVSFYQPGITDVKEIVLKTGVEDSKYILSYEKDIMKTELYVYDLLKDTMIPTPTILARDFTKTIVGCNYFIMERLSGDNWGHLEHHLSPQNKEELIAEIAQYTAALHNITGPYFGYIKEDANYQYSDWRSAFYGMVNMTIADGKEGHVNLPYTDLLQAFEPLWPLLDEIQKPCLVNFDMWKKNIMLKNVNGTYAIDGILDHERAFFGDPYADFLSSNTICGDVTTCGIFQANYSKVSGKPFTFTHNDQIRLCMYNIYLTLLMGVEVYRYNEEDTQNMLNQCNKTLNEQILALKNLCK